ncbi:MAG TPA: GNAT family N-acetyltransferase [Myxococcaceae bacterium]|jgi:GNAT superfamily N-acetyltransferase
MTKTPSSPPAHPTAGLAQVQKYFRDSAAARYEAVDHLGFTACFHPASAEPSFSYAIPGPGAAREQVREFVAWHREECRRRGRQVRFEFIEGFAPWLCEELDGLGLARLETNILMSLGKDSFKPAPAVAGCTLETGTAHAPAPFLREVMAVQGYAFGGAPVTPSLEDAEGFRKGLGESFLALARSESGPLSASCLMTPVGGLAEVAGVATVPEARQRGLGSWVSSACVQEAWRRGVECVVLTAGSARAGRVYEGLGFGLLGQAVAYGERS